MISNKLNEVLKPLKVNNDDLPQNKTKRGFRVDSVGDFDESIEPSYLEWDLRYYADPPDIEFGL